MGNQLNVTKQKTILTIDKSRGSTLTVEDSGAVIDVSKKSVSLIKDTKKPEILSMGFQGPTGPTGPQGIQGLPGFDGDKTYIHTQSAASTLWTVVHNLNKHPAVTVIDSGDNTVEGDVHYIDDNTLTIAFSVLFGGKAYLN